jgi:tRNA-dihydrouridine synthase
VALDEPKTKKSGRNVRLTLAPMAGVNGLFMRVLGSFPAARRAACGLFASSP